MSERVDVVVVGARWAGAATATHLARQGRSVVVLDRLEDFTRPTPSTHILHVDGADAAFELGLLTDDRHFGAPYIRQTRVTVDGTSCTAPFVSQRGQTRGGLCIRRHLVDPLLLDLAADAGAEVRTACSFTRPILQGGRVAGVRYRHDGAERAIRADLVIGADGRRSFFARSVGAETFNVVEGQRFIIWAYFAAARGAHTDTAHLIRQGSEFHLALPTDSGLVLVISDPPLMELDKARAGAGVYLTEKVRQCPQLADFVGDGHMVETPRIVGRTDSFFRQPTGPGWALVGDSTRFVDPACGRGMSDALHQAHALASSLRGLTLGQAQVVDAALSEYRRNLATLERPWSGLMEAQCRLGSVSPLERAAITCLGEAGSATRLAELTARQRTPGRLVPTRLLPAVALSAIRTDGVRATVTDALQLGATEVRHRLRTRELARTGS